MSLAMRAAAVMYQKHKQNDSASKFVPGRDDKKSEGAQRRYFQEQINEAVSEEDYRRAAYLKKKRDSLSQATTHKGSQFVQQNKLLGCGTCHTEVSCWYKSVAELPAFQTFIFIAILLAAVMVGIQTYLLSEQVEIVCLVLDEVVVGIFVAEVFIKIFAEGKRPWRYLANAWNVFDFIIVLAGFIPFDGGSAVMAIRLIRLLRVLKLIRVLPKLRIMIMGLLRSMKSIGYIGLLLMLLFYIYAVICVSVFATNDPWHFGNLLDAMLSLFRMSTLEDWTDIMYIGIYGCDVYGYDSMPDDCKHPQAFSAWVYLFFISYIFFSSFMILNLFIGVITSSMDDAKDEVDNEGDNKEEVDLSGFTEVDEPDKPVTGDKKMFMKYGKLLGTDKRSMALWSLKSLSTEIEKCEANESKVNSKVKTKTNMFNFIENIS